MSPKNTSAAAKEENVIRWIQAIQRIIFGEKVPDIYTKTTFFLNILLWVMFFSYSLLQLLSIQYSHLFLVHKGVDLAQLIQQRGNRIGFEGNEFLNQLIFTQQISLVGWTIAWIGLVLLWRQKMAYTFFFFGGNLLVFSSTWYLLGSTYLQEDIPFFLKVLFLLLNANAFIYSFLLFRKKNGDITFFEDGEVP